MMCATPQLRGQSMFSTGAPRTADYALANLESQTKAMSPHPGEQRGEQCAHLHAAEREGPPRAIAATASGGVLLVAVSVSSVQPA